MKKHLTVSQKGRKKKLVRISLGSALRAEILQIDSNLTNLFLVIDT